MFPEMSISTLWPDDHKDLIRKDRMNKRGGGCLKEELKVTVIDLANVENTESAWYLGKIG